MRGQGVLLSPLDVFWHLANFFAPAVGMAAISAALAKLLWRSRLAGVPWRRLFARTALCCALVAVAGLVVFSRDGKMATYAAMVVACAASLWWLGFGRAGR